MFEKGDKVFLACESRLATILDNYGNPVSGDHGEMRLDVSGNTSVDKFVSYDANLHANFDHTFTPIKAEWKEQYGITQDIPLWVEASPPSL